MEVVWKAETVILDFCFTASITFSNVLHGFRLGCGTGTNSLKFKILHQLMNTRREVLYVIFLDLHKAYEAFDKDR